MFYELLTSVSIEYAVMAVLLGVLLGMCLTLTGVGGGVLIIPALQLLFNMPVVMAVGTASIIASLVKLNAAFSHIKSNNIEWRYVHLILVGAVPMVFIATSIILRASNAPEYAVLVQHLVQLSVIAVMVVSFIVLAWSMNKSAVVYTDKQRGKRRAVAVGVLSGAVLGATGIGGGVILLPALTSGLGCSAKKAVGTSIVIALVLSGMTAFIYSGGSQSHVTVALFVALGSVVGVPLGIRAITYFGEVALYRLTLLMIAVSLSATLCAYFLSM